MSWFDPTSDSDNASSAPSVLVDAAQSIAGQPLNILKATILQGRRRLRGSQPLADATGSSSSASPSSQAGSGSDSGSNGVSSSGRSPISKGTPAESGIAPSAEDVTSGYGASAPPSPVQLPPSSVEMPQLAEQGPQNPFLRVLSRITGMTKGSPEPGQPYTGPIGEDQKLGALKKFVGNLGEDLEGIGGGNTPQERVARMELPVQERNIAAQQAMTRVQLESLNDWRQGQLGVKQQQEEINRQKNDIQSQKNDADMRRRFYVPDANFPGSYRAMTPDELTGDSNNEVRHAAVMYKNAQTDLARAHTDALTNPQNAQFQMKLKVLQERFRIADANLALAQHRASQADAALSMRGRIAQWQFGTNPLNDEQITPDNAAAGMMEDAQGNVVPYKMLSTQAPTAQTRNMAQTARTVPQHIADLRQLIQKADQLGYVGPAAGRVYQGFLAGKVGGTGDPDADQLLGNLIGAKELMASAMTRTHFGGRGGEKLVARFDNLLQNGGSAAELNGVLDQFGQYIGSYSGMDSFPKTGDPPRPISNAASAAKRGTSLSLDEAKDYLRRAGGDKAKARALAAAEGRTF
jgi:hypothetical protein